MESIAACPGKPSALTMYYTANIAFMNYFDNLIEHSEIENWTCIFLRTGQQNNKYSQ